MSASKYINPFSEIAITLAEEFDDATINKDITELEKVIKKALFGVESEDDASKSVIFYSLGTAYGDLQALKGITDESRIKKQIYYYRKSIKLIDAKELTKQEYTPMC